MNLLKTILGWFRKKPAPPQHTQDEDHMKQFSEENLDKLYDRLEFLEYTMKFAIGVANANRVNPTLHQQTLVEATNYHNLVNEEVFSLRMEIAALEAFLDIQDQQADQPT